MVLLRLLFVLLSAAANDVPHKDWQSTMMTAQARNLYLLNNTVMSDIKFTFEESRRQYFYAHKYVLATRSPVFYSKFYEDGVATKNVTVIHLPDVDEETLMEFLRFLYTDECVMTPYSAAKVIKLAIRYVVPSLEAKCVDVLRGNTTFETAFTLVEEAGFLENDELEEKCWEIIDTETNKALASKNFIGIARTTLVDLLKRDTLRITEVDLFKAVLKWADHQCLKKELNNTRENRRVVLGDALYELRFLLMSQEEFAQNVPPSGLLTNDEIVPIYQKMMGIDSQKLKWNITQTRSTLLRFTRFFQTDIKAPDSGWLSYLFPSIFSKNPDSNWWHYWTGKPAHLCFSVNKAALFYGVRLFGDGTGSEYEVSLEFKGSKINGKYIPEFVAFQDYGFYTIDVAFPKAILIKPYEDVAINVYATGPKSFFGLNEKTSVMNDELTVYFGNTNSYFYTKHRQIYEIMLFPIKK